MMIQALKRGLKKHITERGSNNFSLTKIFGFIAIISTVVFCVTQLSINADLNPKGAKLEALNREKNLLIEDNRQLEKEIADAESLPVIIDIAQTKLNLQENGSKQVIHISDSRIVANAE